MDSATGRILWRHRQQAPFNSAALTTAGGLVFIGDWNRYVNAYDASSGKLLWQSRVLPMALTPEIKRPTTGNALRFAFPPSCVAWVCQRQALLWRTDSVLAIRVHIHFVFAL